MAKNKKKNKQHHDKNEENHDTKEESKKMEKKPVKKPQKKEIKRDKGTGLFKMDSVFNFFLVTCQFALVYMMHYYDNYSTAAWIWTFMFIIHMNIMLLGKLIFPFNFDDRVGIIGAIISVALNCLYLYPGYLIYSRQISNEISHERIAGSLLMLIFGTFLSTTANCQKYFTIKAIKAKDPKAEVLITDGLFSWTRNPNFLGDIILSYSFCFFVNDCNSWYIYSFLLFISMYPRLMLKEASLRKKKGAEAYFKRT